MDRNDVHLPEHVLYRDVELDPTIEDGYIRVVQTDPKQLTDPEYTDI